MSGLWGESTLLEIALEVGLGKASLFGAVFLSTVSQVELVLVVDVVHVDMF